MRLFCCNASVFPHRSFNRYQRGPWRRKRKNPNPGVAAFSCRVPVQRTHRYSQRARKVRTPTHYDLPLSAPASFRDKAALTFFGGGEQLLEFRRVPQGCDQGIFLQRSISAIVPVDGALDQAQRNVLSAAGSHQSGVPVVPLPTCRLSGDSSRNHPGSCCFAGSRRVGLGRTGRTATDHVAIGSSREDRWGVRVE
jgi:hypothetical protein